MSEFKKGDRVRVEVEATVDYVAKYTDGLDLIDGEGRRFSVHDHGVVTLLERAVEPLAPGSAVRDATDGSTLLVTNAGVTRVYNDGSVVKSAHTAEFIARRLAYGAGTVFTLIHDGSKK